MTIDDPRPYYNPEDPDNPYVRFQRDYGGLNFKRLEDLVNAGTGNIGGLVTIEEFNREIAKKGDKSVQDTLVSKVNALDAIDFNSFALKAHLDELEQEFDNLDFRLDAVERRPEVDLTPYAKTADVNTAISTAIDGLIPDGTDGQYLRFDDQGNLIASDVDEIDLDNYYTKTETDTKVSQVVSNAIDGLPDYLTQEEADARYPLDEEVPDFSNLNTGVEGQSLILQADGTYAPGGVPDTTDLTNYYTKTETDGEIEDAIAAHTDSPDPHPQYTTQTENDGRYVQPSVLADYVERTEFDDTIADLGEETDNKLADYYTKEQADDKTSFVVNLGFEQHANELDPHPQYLKSIPDEYITQSELDPQLETKQDKLVGDQDQLVGFDEDGNAVAVEAPVPDLTSYYTKVETDDLLDAKADSGHSHDEYVTQDELDPQLAAKANQVDFGVVKFGDWTTAMNGQVAKWDNGKLVPAADNTGSGGADLSNYYTKLQTDNEIDDAITAHTSASHPHSQYLRSTDLAPYAKTADVNSRFNAVDAELGNKANAADLANYADQGYVDDIFSGHINSDDPHPQYLTELEADERYLQSIDAEYVTEQELQPLLDAKQDKLIGTEGQWLKFDAEGNPVAADYQAPDLSDYSTTAQVVDYIEGAIEDHETADDPHTQYLKETDASTIYAAKTDLTGKLDRSELGGAQFGDWSGAVDGQVAKWQNGELVPALDATGSPADFTNYYTKTQTDAEIDDAITAHNSATDPHPQYMSVEEGDFRYAKPSDLEEYATNADLATGLAGKANAADLDDYALESDVNTALAGKADSVHTHAISDTTGLQSALDSKLDDSQLGTSVASLIDGKVPNEQLPAAPDYSNTYAAKVHGHAIADVTGLQGELNNKADDDHGHVIADVDGLQTALDSKATASDLAGYAKLTNGKIAESVVPDSISRVGHTHSEYALVAHNHAIGDVTGLQTALDGKANSTHTHSIANVTGLQSALDAKANVSDLANYAVLTGGKISADVVPDLGSTYVRTNRIGAASGVAGLDTNSKVPAAQLPIGTDVAAFSHTHPYIPTSAINTASGVAGLDANLKIAFAQIPTGTTSTTVSLGNHTHSQYVALTGNQTVAGVKTFSSAPVSSVAASANNELIRKGEVDTLVATKANTSHTHAISDTTGLQTALDNKLDDSQLGAANGVASLDADGKLPNAQLPTLDYVTNSTFTTALNGKANTTHQHAISDVTNLEDRLNALLDDSQAGQPNGIATLDANGLIPTSQIPDLDMVYVRDDELQGNLDTKANVNHSHAIADVTGLQNALDGKSNNGHAHIIANVTGLQDALDAKSATGHLHDDRYSLLGHNHDSVYVALSGDQTIAGTKTFSSAPVIPVGTAANHAVRRDDSRLTDARTPTAHVHAISEVTNLQTTLDGKAASSHVHSAADVTSGTFALARIPTGTTSSTVALGNHNHDSVYSAIGHTHSISNITNLQTTLDGKAASSHSHAISDVTNLQSSLDAKASTSHTHALTSLSDYDNTNAPTDGQIVKYVSSTSKWTPVTLTATDVGAAASGHNHDSVYVSLSGNQTIGGTKIFSAPPQIPVGTQAYHGVRRDDSRLTDARTPLAHVHVISDVTNLQSSLDAKAATSHVHAIADVTDLQTTLDGKSATGHNHDGTYIAVSARGAANGVASLDSSGKVPSSQLPASSGNQGSYTTGIVPNTSALPSITHGLGTTDVGVIIREVSTGTEIPVASEALDGNTVRLTFNSTPSSGQYRYLIFAGAPFTGTIGPHTHAAADIISGTFAIGQIPTGTTSTTVSLGNHTHAYIPTSDRGATNGVASLSSGKIPIAQVPTGTSSSTVALGNHSHTASDVGAAAASHVHDASAITTGTMSTDRLPVGTDSGTIAAGDHVHAGVIATYLNTAGTSMPANGGYQIIPFATTQDTGPHVTRNAANTIFTLNTAGVYMITAGVRMGGGPSGQQKYLAILDGSNTLIRYVEQQNYQSNAGGSFNVARTKRFSAGSTIQIGVVSTGSGTITIANDTQETNFVSIVYMGP